MHKSDAPTSPTRQCASDPGTDLHDGGFSWHQPRRNASARLPELRPIRLVCSEVESMNAENGQIVKRVTWIARLRRFLAALRPFARNTVKTLAPVANATATRVARSAQTAYSAATSDQAL